jgi:hypothetical protein
MSWDQLKEVSQYGVEIGNHSHSHGYFLNYPDSLRKEKFRMDVEKAHQLIRTHLDLLPRVFAYPYGEFDTSMQQVIVDLGFTCAAAQNSGVISRYSDPFALPRFPMTNFYGKMDQFGEKLKTEPLPVFKTIPEITLSVDNPPELTIYFDPGGLDINRLQCFIQGSDCRIIDMNLTDKFIKIIAKDPLKNRRHLYTVTIPSARSGVWYWYSHQWIFPEIRE